MAGRKQRDKHGRYKGKGGIKAFKSNLPAGGGRKRMSKKKKAAIAVGMAAGAVGVVAVAKHKGIGKRDSDAPAQRINTQRTMSGSRATPPRSTSETLRQAGNISQANKTRRLSTGVNVAANSAARATARIGGGNSHPAPMAPEWYRTRNAPGSHGQG